MESTFRPKKFRYIVKKPNIDEPRPTGTLQGVTYMPDESSVRLCLLAPQKIMCMP